MVGIYASDAEKSCETDSAWAVHTQVVGVNEGYAETRMTGSRLDVHLIDPESHQDQPSCLLIAPSENQLVLDHVRIAH